MESPSVERAISVVTNLTQTHKSNVGKSDNGPSVLEFRVKKVNLMLVNGFVNV